MARYSIYFIWDQARITACLTEYKSGSEFSLSVDMSEDGKIVQPVCLDGKWDDVMFRWLGFVSGFISMSKFEQDGRQVTTDEVRDWYARELVGRFQRGASLDWYDIWNAKGNDVGMA
jgi:hypothetical protein